MAKVLVFPAGTEIALEINVALRNCKFVELYGATSVDCHAEMLFKNLVAGMPFVCDSGFIQAMNDVIDMWGIDYVYPAHDDALLVLTRRQKELHAKVITSDFDTVFICRSKYRTYSYLRDEGGEWFLPWFFMGENESIKLPAFAKPDIGQGSYGVKKLDNQGDLDELFRYNDTRYVVCEFLPGEEITVDCFTDRHGELKTAVERTRDRIRSGISVRSEIVPLETRVLDIAKFLNTHFKFNGAWFFQLKKDVNDEYKLLEVAPRIAGTMGLTRVMGINMPLLTLYNIMGEKVDIMRNHNHILLDRAFISRFESDIDYESVYIDLDDTIVAKGKVNPMVMAFLYQASNEGKKIILMTRHRGDIFQELDKYHVPLDLFHSVIFVGPQELKSDYVNGNSIFIDDSFAERKDVHDWVCVPTFAVDAVESLIDWRA